jgi:hypothetical protein
MSDDEDLMFKVALVAGAYFVIIKPILHKLGLDTDPESEAAVNNMDTVSPEDNPFNVHFAPFQELHDNFRDTNMTVFYAALKDNCNDSLYPQGSYFANLCYQSELIYDAFGFWHNAKIDDIMSVFGSLEHQTDVTEIAAYLLVNHDIDLWNWLKNGYTFMPNWRNGISDQNLNTIIKKVESLPE